MTAKPLELTDCTATNLRKVNRLITTLYDNALKPTGLRSTQFTLLATLQQCGQVPLTQLAEVLVTERTTLTRNLKPLIEKNYITTTPSEDQRVKLLSLTDLGEQTLNIAMPFWQDAQLKSVDLLSNERWKILIDELQFAANKLSY